MLKESLYGLKQSPRQWYKRFDQFTIQKDYKRSNFDSCVYFKEVTKNKYIYLLLYVDDMLLAYQDSKEIDKLKRMVKAEFEMKELWLAKKILGIEIIRDRNKGTLFLSQWGYLEKVLSKFGMKDSKPVVTAMA